MKCLTSVLLIALVSITPFAQSGPPYEIKQSVIASGGAASSGAPYSATGTVGQPIAGTTSTGGLFAERGGFWQSDFGPTADVVSISGSVVTAEGMPIRRVRLTLADSSGIVRSAITNPFGHFRFDDVEVGNVYIVTAAHKRYEFAPLVITVNEEITDLVITPAAAK